MQGSLRTVRTWGRGTSTEIKGAAGLRENSYRYCMSALGFIFLSFRMPAE